MKKIIISIAALVVAAAATVAMVSRSESDSLFEANVEALADWETQSKTDPKWWVNYKDVVAIICTPGGKCVCM